MAAPYRFRIVRAAPEDLAGIVSLHKEAFSDPWGESAFKDALTGSRNVFLLARQFDDHKGDLEEKPGLILGYGIIHVVADEAELLNIAVRSDARKNGIGTTLMNILIQEATQRGAARVFLEVRESNQDAVSLYKKHSFFEVGRRRHYYANPLEDAIVLQRNVVEDAAESEAWNSGWC